MAVVSLDGVTVKVVDGATFVVVTARLVVVSLVVDVVATTAATGAIVEVVVDGTDMSKHIIQINYYLITSLYIY